MPANTWQSPFSRIMVFWPKNWLFKKIRIRFSSKNKLFAPLFFLQKKLSPPFFSSKKAPKKTLSPLLSLSKKVCAPLSVVPARVPYKFWLVPDGTIVYSVRTLWILLCAWMSTGKNLLRALAILSRVCELWKILRSVPILFEYTFLNSLFWTFSKQSYFYCPWKIVLSDCRDWLELQKLG